VDEDGNCTFKLEIQMKQLKTIGALTAMALGVVLAGTAHAVPAIDLETGIGFVPKGDVQYTYGWNNRSLQDNAEFVEFQVAATVVTEVSWSCTNSTNEKIQERERTTATTVSGLLATVGRLRNQITGFNLEGYVAGFGIETSTTEGPALNSCPSGPWSLTTPAGDPEVVEETSDFEVSYDGESWTKLMWLGKYED
jgi:hypothetical protein